MNITWNEVNPIIEELSEERIKKDTDYSIVVKYGNVIVTCHAVYSFTIQQCFKEHNIPVNIITFDDFAVGNISLQQAKGRTKKDCSR
jgi:cellobiose-specific phosphotransferase system component IIB